MSNFFDKGLLQNIVVSAVFLILSIWLSQKSNNKTSSGSGWKIVVVISYLMIFSGIYLFAKYFPNGGFNNVYADMGFCLFIFGILFRWLGKFFVWWQR